MILNNDDSTIHRTTKDTENDRIVSDLITLLDSYSRRLILGLMRLELALCIVSIAIQAV